MKAQEFEYLKRAIAALESGECTAMTERKILRTMEQVCGKAATEIEYNLVDKVESNLYNTDIVNN